MSSKLDPWIEGYLSYQKDVRRLGPRSIIDYRCTLKQFSEVMSSHRSDAAPYRASLRDIMSWLNLEREQGRKESVLSKYVSHLRGMLDYAWRSGRTDRNVLDGFQVKTVKTRTSSSALTIEEAGRLVKACPASSSGQRRDRMIVLLLYGCGLRTAELVGLDVRDVDRERHEIVVRHGKGDRQRTVPVPPALWTELLAYLADEGRKRGPLFRTAGRRVRVQQYLVARVVRETALRAGIDTKVTPRTLRHSFGTHLVERGVSVAVVASLMGHRSPAETNVYLHSLKREREKAVCRLGSREDES